MLPFAVRYALGFSQKQTLRQRFGKYQEGVRRKPKEALGRVLHNWGSALLGSL